MKKLIAITALLAAFALLTACGPEGDGGVVSESIPPIEPLATTTTEDTGVSEEATTAPETEASAPTTLEPATEPTTAEPAPTTAATTEKPATKPAATTKATSTEATTAKAPETDPEEEEEAEVIEDEEIPNLDEYLASLFGDDYDDGEFATGN